MNLIEINSFKVARDVVNLTENLQEGNYNREYLGTISWES